MFSRPTFLAGALGIFLVARPLSAQPPVSSALPANARPFSSAAWVVLDPQSGRVLLAKNPDLKLFPASTTKIMTSLVAAQSGDLNRVLTASAHAVKTGESGIGLLVGESRTLAELLRAAMIRSANDACVVIAEGVSGSEPQFVARMNAKARDLGLQHTHFVNPHGLHDPHHYSTARDLSLLGRASLELPFLNEIMRERTAQIGGNQKTNGPRLLINRNRLLWRWDACDGLKTGYTRQAGNCLVATATQTDKNGRPWRLLATVLRARSGQSFPEAERLLQMAFRDFSRHLIARAGQTVWSGKIKGGAFPLEATSARDLAIPLLASEKATFQSKIEIFDLKAPLQKGRIVGHMIFWARGKAIAKMPLRAKESVPQTLLARAVPGLGERISLWSHSQKFGFWAILGAGTAGWFLWRRQSQNPRRRKKKRDFALASLVSKRRPARAQKPKP